VNSGGSTSYTRRVNLVKNNHRKKLHTFLPFWDIFLRNYDFT
jgi:hypothetical protein